jgi:hypothetical protein
MVGTAVEVTHHHLGLFFFGYRVVDRRECRDRTVVDLVLDVVASAGRLRRAARAGDARLSPCCGAGRGSLGVHGVSRVVAVEDRARRLPRDCRRVDRRVRIILQFV